MRRNAKFKEENKEKNDVLKERALEKKPVLAGGLAGMIGSAIEQAVSTTTNADIDTSQGTSCSGEESSGGSDKGEEEGDMDDA